MSETFLLEIGLEEVPAQYIPGAMKQLEEKMTAWLSEERLEYEQIHVFSTPRRLAVRVDGLATKQADIREEAKGPAKKIALDDQNEWTKAALGFAKSQGVAPEDLFFRELKGVEYVYAIKSSVGRPTVEVLQEGLAELIAGMNFPKNMRWGDYDLRFIRPIRWLVALLGDQVIPMQIANVSSDRKTYGHRFLGGEVSLAHANDYVEELRKQFVLVDVEERKTRIVDQITSLAAEKGWDVPMDAGLLEEVLHLVEYPTALAGSFEPEFLEIPEDVLITSMREHQRYFPVNNRQSGKLLPHFVTVRNGDDRSLETVAKGNEKVLRARLADARFFYTEDQKLSIDSALEKLETVVYHEELGSIGDKVRRIVRVASALATEVQLGEEEKKHVERAAAICKFDLVTQMVNEFTELQGIMGEDYALKAGEHPQVASAISEHYQPRFSGDAVPSSKVGAIVSIADKIDTIAGCFAIGIIPTGSQDPYALRRQAAGIVQTIHEHRLDLPLSTLFKAALNVLAETKTIDQAEVQQELLSFFALRVKGMLQDVASYDIVDAVMASGFDWITGAIRRAEALAAFVANDKNEKAIEAFNRVNNLAAKAPENVGSVKPELFVEDVEGKLYAAWTKHHEPFLQHLESDEDVEALHELSQLADVIHEYFDKVMVMAEDENVRQNRLAMLAAIASDIKQIADFQKIVR